MLQVGIYDSPTSQLLEDLTPRLSGLVLESNKNGYGILSGAVSARRWQTFQISTYYLGKHVTARARTGFAAFEGHLEDVRSIEGGYAFSAYGYQNAFRDKRNAYTATASASTSQAVAQAILASVAAANSAIATTTTLIENPGAGITWTETYTRRTPADILDGMAERGDGSARWEWGVWEGRRLHFRQRGLYGRAWFVDVANPNIVRTLENVWNSVYAVVADGLTAEAADSFSQLRYNTKREIVVNPITDDATMAANFRDAWLAYYADPPALGEIPVTRLFDQSGTQWPVWVARPGDSVTLRSLPPTLSTTIDQIRTFRSSRVRCQFQRGQRPLALLTPEFDPPSV